jgi:hypothetical protein
MATKKKSTTKKSTTKKSTTKKSTTKKSTTKKSTTKKSTTKKSTTKKSTTKMQSTTKKSAKQPPWRPASQGRLASPLPAVAGKLAPIVATLAELEQLGIEDTVAANERRCAFVARGIPARDAIELLERIGLDAGEVLPNPDFAGAKTKQDRQDVDREHSRFVDARFERRETLASLYALGARDLTFQASTLERLAETPDAGFRDQVFDAIVSGPELAPSVLAEVRRVARETSTRGASAAGALFRRGPEVALAEIGVRIESVDREDRAALAHAKQLVQVGTRQKAWASAPDAWRKVLAPLAELCAHFDASEGDLGRARWQLGHAATQALATLAGTPEPARAAPQARAKKQVVVIRPPIEAKQLRTAKGREKQLDALGAWIVDALTGVADDERVRGVMRGAIAAFYDIREAADQERGEYAGHFFMVDAVGLGDTDRPVPWELLRPRVGDARLDRLSELFDEALEDVE